MSEIANGGAPAATPSNLSALIQHNMSQPDPTAAPKANPSAQQTQEPPMAEDPNGLAPEADVEPEVPEVEDQETKEAVQDLLEQLYHGKKGREVLEAIGKGELPTELLEKLMGTVKINGEDGKVSYAEALRGYQRSGDYTRGKQELAKERTEIKQVFNTLKGMIEGWKDGASLRSGLKSLGKLEAFKAAAIAYAQEEWQDEQLRRKNPDAYAARVEARKAQERAEELEAKLRQSSQTTNSDQRTQEFAKQLKELTLPAFERLGIPDTPFARERYSDNFRAIYDENGDLASMVQEAAQATADQLSDLAKKYKATQEAKSPQPPKPNPSPLPGRPSAPASAPGGGSGPQRQRLTPSQMAAALEDRRSKRLF
jgi:hypothetical protein